MNFTAEMSSGNFALFVGIPARRQYANLISLFRSTGHFRRRKSILMEPIDRPFRFTWDFCVVWALLTIPAFLLYREWKTDDATWARCASVILLSLFMTFVFYGPILLVRQILRSGSRGWAVARALISAVFIAALFSSGLYYFKVYSGTVALVWTPIITLIVSFYFHWRIDERNRR
jgi:hypothetical protein